jgi:hypothetical protein
MVLVKVSVFFSEISISLNLLVKLLENQRGKLMSILSINNQKYRIARARG